MLIYFSFSHRNHLRNTGIQAASLYYRVYRGNKLGSQLLKRSHFVLFLHTLIPSNSLNSESRSKDEKVQKFVTELVSTYSHRSAAV